MKKFTRFFLFLLCAAVLYCAAAYVYVRMQVRPAKPLTGASSSASYDTRPQVHLVHAVNTVRRARAKDKSFEGIEFDLSRYGGRLLAAHDKRDFKNAPEAADIFAALSRPQDKTYWIDLKTDLTQQDIDQLKALAARFGINARRMLFETSGGETARLLQQNGFPVLLQVIDGFDEDGRDPARRAALNAQMEEQIRLYRPFAIAGSLGKYPYLKTYFPHYNKAVYSATTVRPSLKKKFLKDAVLQDKSVLLFMQDEYTALPF